MSPHTCSQEEIRDKTTSPKITSRIREGAGDGMRVIIIGNPTRICNAWHGLFLVSFCYLPKLWNRGANFCQQAFSYPLPYCFAGRSRASMGLVQHARPSLHARGPDGRAPGGRSL